MRPKIWYANMCVSISQGRGGEQKESNSVVFLFLKEKCGGFDAALRAAPPRARSCHRSGPLGAPLDRWVGGGMWERPPPPQAWL